MQNAMAEQLTTEDTSIHERSSASSTLAPSECEPISTRSSRHVYELVPASETTFGPDPPIDTRVDPRPSPVDSKRVQNAGPLKRSRFHWSVLLPLDVLLALSPIFFFVIASICLSLQNKPKSAYGENIKAITLVAPSIFPILYAAVLGKMLRRVGLYKAERSARIGTVERLVGCQSVFTTAERQIAFRRFDLLGCAIILAWLLSPLSGQSSLRMLNTQPLTKELNSTAWYFPIEGIYRHSLIFSGQGDQLWTLWAPTYMTALQTSRQYRNLPMDLYGNVKIPDIRQLSTSSTQLSDYDWHEVGNTQDVEYSSLLGVLIAGLPESGNSSLQLQSFYWSVQCDDWSLEHFNITETARRPTFNMTLNSWDGQPERMRFLYQSRRVTQSIQDGAQIMGYVYTSACYATPFVVESKVQCIGRSCSVKSMRRLERNGQRILSPFDGPVDFLSLTLRQMPGADIGYTPNNTPYRIIKSSELVEHWLANPDLTQFSWVARPTTPDWTLEERWVNLTALSPAEFGPRLQMAMNTFWGASVGGEIRMGNLTLAQINIVSTDYSVGWNDTEVTGVAFDGEQYTCDVMFATITMGISFALFLAALISLTLGIIIRAPDILGYVSTSARDNPYVKEHISSHMDGLQAARALQDVQMRIGDVQGHGDVGHVAFTTTDAEGARLSRKRLYD